MKDLTRVKRHKLGAITRALSATLSHFLHAKPGRSPTSCGLNPGPPLTSCGYGAGVPPETRRM